MAKVFLRVQPPTSIFQPHSATHYLTIQVHYHLGLEFLRTGLGLLRTAGVGGSA